jgi:aspartate aminotransferase-like enzyme
LALHEALRLICDETLKRRFARHEHCSLGLQSGIENMGLKLKAHSSIRLNSVGAIEEPDGVHSERARNYKYSRFKVEISGAFGLNYCPFRPDG